MEKHSAVRDSWGSKWGFILACIGSAVGMGNIWLFPARVSQYGGATFLIPYLIFVVIIGSTGVIGEMAFGRATRSGPIGAFGYATKLRFGHRAARPPAGPDPGAGLPGLGDRLLGRHRLDLQVHRRRLSPAPCPRLSGVDAFSRPLQRRCLLETFPGSLSAWR